MSFWQLAGRTANRAATHIIHTSLACPSASSDCTFAARHARIDPDQEEEPGNTTPGISAPNLDQAKAYLDVWK